MKIEFTAPRFSPVRVLLFLLLAATPLAADAGSEQNNILPERQMEVNKIHIESLDVFDPKIPEYRRWIFQFLNSVHNRTNDSFIRRELLMKEGDWVDSDIIQESERNLRKHHFLDNVDIRAEQVGSNKVDLYVHTEDQWTTQLDVSLGKSSGYTKFGLGLEESNFLGFGKTIGLEFDTDPERTSYRTKYADPQFLNTRWNFSTSYESASDGWRYRSEILHPFYSIDTRWAYGVSWDSGIFSDKIYHKGRTVAEIDTDHRTGIFFAARSWGKRYDKRKFGFLGSLDNYLYPHPVRILYPDAADIKEIRRNLDPQDRETYQYGAIFKWDHENFVEESYLDNFGRVEDLPVGFQVGSVLTYSEAVAPYPNYYQLQAIGQYSKQLNSDQYFTSQADFRIHRTTSGEYNNLFFYGYAHYYLKMDELRIGKMTFPRQTLAANVQATLTEEIDAPFQLSLGENEGLRGYTFKYFTGQNSLLVNLEDRIFTPFNYRLFAIGLVGFMDTGYVWSSEEHLKFDDFGVSVGFGLRIGLKKAQSARVVRIDFAIPLKNQTGDLGSSAQKGYSISFSSGHIFPILERLPRLFELF